MILVGHLYIIEESGMRFSLKGEIINEGKENKIIFLVAILLDTIKNDSRTIGTVGFKDVLF